MPVMEGVINVPEEGHIQDIVVREDKDGNSNDPCNKETEREIVNALPDVHIQDIIVKEELLCDEDKVGYSNEEIEYGDYSNKETEKFPLVITNNFCDTLLEHIEIKEEASQAEVEEVEYLLSNAMYKSSHDCNTEKEIPNKDQNSAQLQEDFGFHSIFDGDRSGALKTQGSSPLRKRLKSAVTERVHYRVNGAHKMSPVDVFRIFFNNKLVSLMLWATSESWRQCRGRELLLTEQCMEKFFAILMLSELNCQPNFSDYWSENKLYGNELVRKAMTHEKFCHIMENLSFTTIFGNDECHSLSKLQPFINNLSQSFKLYTPGEKVVFSERIIDMGDESSQFEYRLFKLCSVEGYTWSFKMDIGNKAPLTSRIGTVRRIMISLLDGLLMESRILYVQHYASFDLAKNLLEKNTYICGSLKAGTEDAHQRDALQQDALLTSISNDDGMTIQQCEIDFELAKKGAALSDQRTRVSVPLLQCRQWHVRAACELLLGSAVTNAFILFNKYHTRKKLNEIQFRESIILALLNASSSSDVKDKDDIGRSAAQSQEVP